MRTTTDPFKLIACDIETGPADNAIAMLPAFDPAEIKTGNLKDEAKIAEKIAAAKASHEADFLNKAALDATAGRVLLVGFFDGKEHTQFEGHEIDILGNTWAMIREVLEAGDTKLVFHNGNNFDIPFLIRRSWVNSVTLPMGLLYRDGRYLSDLIVDTMKVWGCGDYKATISLDRLARCLGIGSKTGKGGDFAATYAADKFAALAYAQQDCALTWLAAKRLRCDR